VAFFLLASVLIGSLVLALAVVNALLAQASFRVKDLSDRVGSLSQGYERKQLRVAELSAPDRIARQAHRLGLALPSSEDVHVIEVPRGAAAHLGGRGRATGGSLPEAVTGGSG